ncbi:hypothetical protein A6M27_15140 [Acidithiobacillus thiooxidans]|uniref:hypothetical protein n=1 Tax=Acidithiobacillus thiooxidans TaxID=930 RepID=UPI00046520A0|nr:hypothetical protein [Acidithiobacillus thiooxidans]OCX72837.1 hypothetical protein A6O24_13030 [Acidithiobacillus thiooxidans]OCX83476.1 hypothetical protein A6O26_07030 [Acidithiobacillus thiooxidans]OCX85416.1 hypothetical protein A6M27_15140 [Acidithiobacillus thiooxidans]OFC50306.1 hypothetical protein BAE47_03125 [Acidithiobacillus thiooxidans]
MHLSAREKLLLKIDLGLLLGFLAILAWDGNMLLDIETPPSWTAWIALFFLFTAGFYGILRGGPTSAL